MTCVSLCVNMSIYWNKIKLIWTFCEEMALWQVEGSVYSHNTLLPIPEVEKSKTAITIFFSIPWILWAPVEYELLLDFLKNWFGIFVWKCNKWRGYISTTTRIVTCSTREWHNSYHFLWFFFFHSINCVSSCVKWTSFETEQNWFRLFVLKWHYDKFLPKQRIRVLVTLLWKMIFFHLGLVLIWQLHVAS